LGSAIFLSSSALLGSAVFLSSSALLGSAVFLSGAVSAVNRRTEQHRGASGQRPKVSHIYFLHSKRFTEKM